MKLTFLSVIGAAAILFAAMPLPAHHSFAATYLEDAPPVEIKGTLKSFKIQNPHSYVQIEDEKLKDAEGNPVRWVVEWGAAAQLARTRSRCAERGKRRAYSDALAPATPSRHSAIARVAARSSSNTEPTPARSS